MSFGDGDTGFYESGDDLLNFSGTWLQGSVSGSWRLNNEIASSTNPIYSSRYGSTTGVGFPGANQLSLIAGGLQGLQIAE